MRFVQPGLGWPVFQDDQPVQSKLTVDALVHRAAAECGMKGFHCLVAEGSRHRQDLSIPTKLYAAMSWR